MLTDKFSSSTTARLWDRRATTEITDPSNLKHAGDSTSTDLKTLEFPARSAFLLATGGEMAYAEDLKSSGAKAPCGFESRPRHLKTNDFQRTRRIIRG